MAPYVVCLVWPSGRRGACVFCFMNVDWAVAAFAGQVFFAPSQAEPAPAEPAPAEPAAAGPSLLCWPANFGANGHTGRATVHISGGKTSQRSWTGTNRLGPGL